MTSRTAILALPAMLAMGFLAGMSTATKTPKKTPPSWHEEPVYLMPLKEPHTQRTFTPFRIVNNGELIYDDEFRGPRSGVLYKLSVGRTTLLLEER